MNCGVWWLRKIRSETSSSTLTEKLSAIEHRLVQPRAAYRKQLHALPVQINDQLYRLSNFVGAGYGRPTEAQYQMFEEFQQKARESLRRLHEALAEP